MDDDEIIYKVKCCISGKPLDLPLCMIQTEYLATWEYPVCSNVLTNEPGLARPATAVAFIRNEYLEYDDHDNPIRMLAELKYVVEFLEDEVIYHPIEHLQKAPTVDTATSPLQVWPTDIKFFSSPDAGENCQCSRCLEPILDCPIRMWDDDGQYEYRYHPECVGMKKV